MKIYTTYRDEFFSSIKSMFRGHDVDILNPKNIESVSYIDYVVFPGGIDINPELYGRKTPRNVEFDNDRDSWEREVYRRIMLGKLKVKKGFGICRGMQLFNVMAGGTLHYDIYDSYGKNHEAHHPLIWKQESPLAEIFPHVNSIHHQGVENLGQRMPYMVLAAEPTTSIVEVAVWSNRFLGMQFHPELMPYNDSIAAFVKILEDWKDDKIKLHSERRKPVVEFYKADWNISGYTAYLNSLDTDHEPSF